MIGDKSGIYQSTLFKHGPATVTITSDPMASKYPKGYGRVVYLTHEGHEQNIMLENKACEDALRGLKGQTVTIEATGSKEAAGIKVTGGTQAVSPATTTANGKPQAAKVNVPLEARAGQVGELMKQALITGEGIRGWYEKNFPAQKPMSNEQFIKITGDLFYYLERQGYVDSFPIKSGAEQAADGDIPF